MLTLDLQLEAIEAGFSLKDATPFNVQFRGPHPVFIDLPSIERPRRFDLWYALGQFSRTFLFPLLLHRHRGWDLRSYFLGNLDGRDSNAVVRSFGTFGRWHPALWLDVTLPWLLERLAERRPRRPAPVSAAPSVNREPVRLNLQRLRRKIVKLRDSHRPAGLWARYTTLCNYDAEAEKGKKDFVRRMLRAASPASVLDLGCNTGDYSLAAAELGCAVTAIDQDPESIDILYRRAKEAAVPILPLVVDVTNPSPALGFRLAERPSFYDRGRADCVLALALMHHLVVSGNLSLPAVCELFDDLTREHLLLEFVPPRGRHVPTPNPVLARFLRRSDSGGVPQGLRRAIRHRRGIRGAALSTDPILDAKTLKRRGLLRPVSISHGNSLIHDSLNGR